jgi:hypothetical protein
MGEVRWMIGRRLGREYAGPRAASKAASNRELNNRGRG